MIPKHKALKLLAWVDGELGWWSSLRISRWTARDADARALAEELRATRSLLHGNEPARTLPEGRELYWSRISNGILAGEASVVEIAEPRLAANWGRLSWLPAGAMAAAVLLALGMWFGLWPGRETALVGVGDELETPIAEMSSFAFRSETEHMTVVWVSFGDRERE